MALEVDTEGLLAVARTVAEITDRWGLNPDVTTAAEVGAVPFGPTPGAVEAGHRWAQTVTNGQRAAAMFAQRVHLLGAGLHTAAAEFSRLEAAVVPAPR